MKSLVRYLLMSLGVLAVGLAVLGIFLPLIPTTPLLLLAAFCFFRSSEKLYHGLLSHPWLGPYIRQYREGRGIPRKAKWLTMAVLWLTMAVSFIFVITHNGVRTVLFLIASAVTIYLLSLNEGGNRESK